MMNALFLIFSIIGLVSIDLSVIGTKGGYINRTFKDLPLNIIKNNVVTNLVDEKVESYFSKETLEKFKEKQNRLQASYAKAVTKLHIFNDENNASKDEEPVPTPPDMQVGEEQPVEQPKKKAPVRVTKNISEYMPKNRVINVDGEEGIALLDSVFEEIKDQIKKDLKVGKKITLQL